jgi:hypothetical protein
MLEEPQMSLHLKLFQTDTEMYAWTRLQLIVTFFFDNSTLRGSCRLYTDPVSHAIFSLFSRKHTFCIPLWRTSTFPPKSRKNNHFIDKTIKYFKQFVLLLATHAQFGRHTVFCMSEMDYPRTFVSFPRIAGSGNEIGFICDGVIWSPALKLMGAQNCFRTRVKGERAWKRQYIERPHPWCGLRGG